MQRLIERAGEEPFDDAIRRVLTEPLNDTLVDIRPDGLLYVSHPHYRDRLDRAFGVGGWALVPLERPQIKDNKVYYWGYLKAHGRFIGDAYGEAVYYPNNKAGSYGNSVESAKSDCLVRCCKALPMFRQLWDREFCDYWISLYAETGYTRQSGNQKVWKKKGEAMRDFTRKDGDAHQGEYHRASRLEDENMHHLREITETRTERLILHDEYNDNEPFNDDGRED